MSAVAKAAHVWERDGLDWYVEERRCTSGLLTVERFVGAVWDPSCGGGNIVEEMLAAGVDAVGTDIKQRVQRWWFRGERDFLAFEGQPLAQNIVMNPPFFRAKGAEAFIRKALSLATGKVVAFVDIKFLAGGARAQGLYADLPPTRVWVISPRPSCPPGEYLANGGKAEGGTADWCWLVWDLTAPRAETQIRWLRCTSTSSEAEEA
ncbi:hypothetical protein [Hansschlegelia plantiphila]|uniref:Uncharacterized protein n=1 Tax=Hansschlegelia plantiphila TaxID=374655 RepID=A0A9W6MW80_9HYPH|nr:hypothetical protein [Hansschlegelia plantiphila]GLK69204.1 hypothetical protein GCM10008179_28420 [Hansschlegelia plantiphila]